MASSGCHNDASSIEEQSQALLYAAAVANNNHDDENHTPSGRSHRSNCMTLAIICLAITCSGILALFGMFLFSFFLLAFFGVILYWTWPKLQPERDALAVETTQETREEAHRPPHTRTSPVKKMSKHELEKKLVSLQNVAQGRCEICLADITVFTNRDIVTSPNPACCHVFHKKCILKWLREKSTCPCCREPYVLEKEGVDTKQEGFNDEAALSIGSGDRGEGIELLKVNTVPVSVRGSGNNDEEQWRV